MSKDIYPHRHEVQHGYNKKLDQYYIKIIDVDDGIETKIYVKENDFIHLANSMIENVKHRKKEKEK